MAKTKYTEHLMCLKYFLSVRSVAENNPIYDQQHQGKETELDEQSTEDIWDESQVCTCMFY